METFENNEARTSREENESNKIELRHRTLEPDDGARDQINSARFIDVNKSFENQERQFSKRDQILLASRSFVNGVMPQLFASSSILFLFWLLAYFFFMAVLVSQTVQTLADFMAHPVNVEIVLESTVSELEFPAVALCNNNLVRKNYISRVTYLRSLALLDKTASVNFHKNESQTCSEFGMFSCWKFGNCIPEEWVCNGREECNEGEDEPKDVVCQNKDPNYNPDGSFCIQGYAPCPGEQTCAKYCDGYKECVLFPGYDESERGGCNDTCIKSLVATSEAKTLQSLNYQKTTPIFWIVNTISERLQAKRFKLILKALKSSTKKIAILIIS